MKASGIFQIETILRVLKVKFEKEYRFHPKRKWRFDFYLPDHRTGIEFEGRNMKKGAHEGRHTSWKGFTEDCIKYSWANILGYKVLRVTAPMLYNGQAYQLIEAIIKYEDEKWTS